MARVAVARRMEHLQVANDALLQRQQADLLGLAQRAHHLPNDFGRGGLLGEVGGLHVVEDADLAAAVAESKWVANVGHQQRRDDRQVEN